METQDIRNAFYDTLEYLRSSEMQGVLIRTRKNTLLYPDNFCTWHHKPLCNGEVAVIDRTPVETCVKYGNEAKTAVLMTGDALNPGESARKGIENSETELCICTSVYPCLTSTEQGDAFYTMHARVNQSAYTDRVLYVREVPVIKTKSGKIIPFDKRVNVDVMVIAVPQSADSPTLHDIYKSRIKNALDVAIEEGVKVIISDAFNKQITEAKILAKAYAEVIQEGHYTDQFEKILFTIPDYETRMIFASTFQTKQEIPSITPAPIKKEPEVVEMPSVVEMPTPVVEPVPVVEEPVKAEEPEVVEMPTVVEEEPQKVEEPVVEPEQEAPTETVEEVKEAELEVEETPTEPEVVEMPAAVEEKTEPVVEEPQKAEEEKRVVVTPEPVKAEPIIEPAPVVEETVKAEETPTEPEVVEMPTVEEMATPVVEEPVAEPEQETTVEPVVEEVKAAEVEEETPVVETTVEEPKPVETPEMVEEVIPETVKVEETTVEPVREEVTVTEIAVEEVKEPEPVVEKAAPEPEVVEMPAPVEEKAEPVVEEVTAVEPEQTVEVTSEPEVKEEVPVVETMPEPEPIVTTAEETKPVETSEIVEEETPAEVTPEQIVEEVTAPVEPEPAPVVEEAAMVEEVPAAPEVVETTTPTEVKAEYEVEKPVEVTPEPVVEEPVKVEEIPAEPVVTPASIAREMVEEPAPSYRYTVRGEEESVPAEPIRVMPVVEEMPAVKKDSPTEQLDEVVDLGSVSFGPVVEKKKEESVLDRCVKTKVIRESHAFTSYKAELDGKSVVVTIYGFEPSQAAMADTLYDRFTKLGGLHGEWFTAYPCVERTGDELVVIAEKEPDGMPLEKLAGKLSNERAMHYMQQIASGMQILHEHGLPVNVVSPSQFKITMKGNIHFIAGRIRTMKDAPVMEDDQKFMYPGYTEDEVKASLYAIGAMTYYLLNGTQYSEEGVREHIAGNPSESAVYRMIYFCCTDIEQIRMKNFESLVNEITNNR